MANLFRRIRKRIIATVSAFRSDCHFSVYYACLRVFHELGGRLGFHKLSDWAYEKKNQWIYHYLQTKLQSVLDTFSNDDDIGSNQENAPIWVCWWTGEETAPHLVQQCVKSIRKNSGDHPVFLITKDNYSEFLDIPNYILDKVHTGQMCVANFSDYLRFSLLAKYGGLWLDATIYCAASLPEDYFQLPVFTCRGQTGNAKYVSAYRWTAFCFGCYRNNILARYMQAAFELYWQQHKVSIDYLLVDQLIHLGYCNIPAIKACLDNIPNNNLHRDDLQAAMNSALPAEQFDSIIDAATVLYKLSWRETYAAKTADGEDTVYAHFLNL